MAGWEMTVESSLSLGPSAQSLRRSYPKISEAWSKSFFAAGTEAATSTAMPTDWAPWPGKKKALVGL